MISDKTSSISFLYIVFILTADLIQEVFFVIWLKEVAENISRFPIDLGVYGSVYVHHYVRVMVSVDKDMRRVALRFKFLHSLYVEETWIFSIRIVFGR